MSIKRERERERERKEREREEREREREGGEREAMCDRNDLAIEQEMNNKGRSDINIAESMDRVCVDMTVTVYKPCIINNK